MEPPFPSMFILRASHDEADESFVLCVSQQHIKDDMSCWSIKIVENSNLFMKGSQLKTNGIEGANTSYNFQRESSRNPGINYYKSSAARTKRYATLSDSTIIHEYRIQKAYTILPSKYYKVLIGRDEQMKWHFKFKYLNHTIPVHVQNIYIDFAIKNGDSCPITLEPFERGNVTCTPCGHLFSTSVMNSLTICATCRANL